MKVGLKRILKHLTYARVWLDRAEGKLSAGSLVEGEVLISLAEAELHKAWELSYFSRRQQRNKLLPITVIAMVVLLFLLGINIVFNSYLQPMPLKLSLAEPREETLSLERSEHYLESKLQLINYDLSINSNLWGRE